MSASKHYMDDVAQRELAPSSTARVLFICMPFAGIDRPALGISLLKAGLARVGIECDIEYFNLLFAEIIGLQSYSLFNYTSTCEPGDAIPYTAFAGDWIFSQYFYGPGSLDAQGYVENVLRSPEMAVSTDNVRMILRLRAIIPSFLRSCLDRIDGNRYTVVGFTSTFEQNMASLCLARLLKERFPHLRIAFGGANCETVMGEELHRQYPFIDFVASGEADCSFPALMCALRAGSSLSNIKGVVRRDNGSMVVAERAEIVRDMDSVPYPDFDDYFRQFHCSSISRSVRPSLQIESSRGCWWGERSHCTFCGLNGGTMAFRSKSAERVLDELTFLAKRYETSYVQFVDNILDLRYFKSLIPELANRKHGLRIFYETKSNLKKDQVRLLSDAGIRDIQPGIESLNTHVLKLMRKGVTALQNIQFLKWCEQYGVKAEWNLLYGFPGENAEAYGQILQILQSMTHFPVPTAVGAIRMDRFSPNFEEANSRGFTNLRPMLPYRYIYPFGSEELLRLCYYFDFDYADGRRPDEYAEEIVAFWYTWRKATGGKRLLQHFVLGDQAYIEDKRFTRRCDRVHLDNIQNNIVIFCDTVRTLEQIQSHLTSSFPERAFEAKRIQAFLNYLIEQRLMVQEEAQYLSIVPQPENNSDVGSGDTEWRLKPGIRPRNESLVEVSA